MIPTGFKGAARRATPAEAERVADELGVPLAALLAVAEVESRGEPFLPCGRPQILFERHIFHRLTDGEFDGVRPDLSDRSPGGYGRGGAGQYARLEDAMKLHVKAALDACSWGRFQVMGFNAELCGWPTVEAFVADICESEAAHLAAFAGYVLGAGLRDELRGLDWRGFARGYNGPDFERHGYHTRMADAYQRALAALGRAAAPVIDLVATDTLTLQKALTRLGIDPGPHDGKIGPRTRGAIMRFGELAVVPVTGAVTPQVLAAVNGALAAKAGRFG